VQAITALIWPGVRTQMLSEIPVSAPGQVASALDAGADDYLVKPVPSGVLVAHLLNLIRHAKNAPEKSISQGEDSGAGLATREPSLTAPG